MPERWEHELGKLQTLEPPAGTRARIAEGPHGEGVPPTPGRGQRVAAAVVALSVFAAAGAFALSAFRGDEPTVAADAGTAVLTLAAGIHPEASLTFDGETAGTVVDSYCWNQPNGAQACADMVPPEPFRPGQFLKVPEGATVVLVNDDAADPVTLTLTPGDDPTLLGLATSFEDLRGLTPGRYVLTVAATWVQSPQPIVFHFALEIVPGEAEPEALAAMLDAPTDGSVPSLELRYGGVEASIHAQGGQWPGGPNAWNDDLQSFPAELPLGTMVTFDDRLAEAAAREGLTCVP